MIIRYTFLEDDFVEFNLYHFQRSPFVKKQRIQVMAVFSVIILAGVLFATRNPESGLSVVARATIGVFVAGLFCVLYHNFWIKQLETNVKRLLQEGSNDGIFGPQEIELCERGFTRRSQTREAFAAWRVVRSIDDIGEFIVIYLSSIEACMIRKSRIIDCDPDNFVSEVKGRIEAAINANDAADNA